MKQFDLQKFLAGEPATTIGGHKIVGFRYDTTNGDLFPLKVIIRSVTGIHVNFQYSINGQPLGSIDYNYFLCMKDSERWVNIYYSKAQDDVWASDFFKSEELAKQHIVSTDSYQATIKINP